MIDKYEEKIYNKVKKKKIKKKIRDLIFDMGNLAPYLYVGITAYLTTVFYIRYIAAEFETDLIKLIIEGDLNIITNLFITMGFMIFGFLISLGIICIKSYEIHLKMKWKGYKKEKTKFEKLINVKKEKKIDGDNKN